MPVRYTLALSQVVAKKPTTSNTILRPNYQYRTVSGTPKGMRDIITTGEVNGIMLAQVAKELLGSLMELIIIIMARMIGNMIGKVRLCASLASSFTALPTAAKSAA